MSKNIYTLTMEKDGTVPVRTFGRQSEALNYKAPSGAKSFVVSSQDDLATISIAALTSLYNGMVDEAQRIVKFSDKASAVKRLWSRIQEVVSAAGKPAREKKPAKPAADGEKKARRSSGPRKESKMSKLRDALKEKGFLSLEAASKACGYDEKNVLVACRILSNPDRTKAVLNIKYDKAARTIRLA